MTYIHNIKTLVPDTCYTHTQVQEMVKSWVPTRKAHRYIDSITEDSGIDKRHSVIRNFERNDAKGFFKSDSNGKLISPGTGERNEIFREEASKLVVEVARDTLESCHAIEKSDVTHIITVSCTGFYTPGPDLNIVQELDLPKTIQRYNLGFMGCYATFPALRMASQFCAADPNAVVLIVSVELCTLHVQLDDKIDTILGNAIFADGTAAAIVSAKAPKQDHAVYKIESFASTLLPDSEDQMAWDIGDHGFNLVLSRYVPKIIGANISELIDGILSDQNLSRSDIKLWALHPGGKSILDKVEKSLSLEPHQIAASREILRCFGNMSSATILFVMQKIMLSQGNAVNSKVCSMAFGPGLTVESALLNLE